MSSESIRANLRYQRLSDRPFTGALTPCYSMPLYFIIFVFFRSLLLAKSLGA